MNRFKLMTAVGLLTVVFFAAPVQAQGQSRTAGRGHAVARPGSLATLHAVSRSRQIARPPITVPYRTYGHYPHTYPSSRGFDLGFSYGSPGYYAQRHRTSWNRFMR